LWSSCLSLPSAWITDVNHHTWFFLWSSFSNYFCIYLAPLWSWTKFVTEKFRS
jgi:hypothetical protein